MGNDLSLLFVLGSKAAFISLRSAHCVVTSIHDIREGKLKNGNSLLTLLFSTSLDL